MLLALALWGCSEAPSGPEPLVAGEDACDGCRMIVSETRYAAEMRQGERLEKYDDIGCLLGRLAAAPGGGAEAWVADWDTGGWVPARSAAYAHVPGLATPMAWGLVAFRTPEAAEAFVRDRRGRVLRFDQLGEVPRPR
jgi:copper chaperone NosL